MTSHLSPSNRSAASQQPTADGVPASRARRFPIVGLGVDATELSALYELLQALPKTVDLAFVLLLTNATVAPENLLELLEAQTALTVEWAAEGQLVQPNTLYVAPVQADLGIEDSYLRLFDPLQEAAQHRPLDFFLRALASDIGEDAIGVLLHQQPVAADQDGIAGLHAIKAWGGYTLIQSPTPSQDGELTGSFDVVETIAAVVAHLLKQVEAVEEYTLLEAEVDPTAAEAQTAGEAIRTILTLVYEQTGHDFSQYKQSTLLRRIGRRLQISGKRNLAEYVQYLQDSPAEAQALYQDCLVSVTNFFRDPDAFETVERDCIPQFFLNRQRGEPIRVWVAGCATGEEAYSIAMLLAERAATYAEAPRVQIFATDVDERAIQIARRGLYPAAIARALFPKRLQRFFTEEPDGYRVKIEIRELVLFAAHNVLKDPPFSKLDLIACRNVLIYFNREAQERVFSLFHYALNPDGYLFLGTSESADAAANLFSIQNKRCHLYQRREVLATAPRRMPTSAFVASLPKPTAARPPDPRPRTLEDLYHFWTLRRFAPPRLLVDENYDITHIFSGADMYLEERDGAVSQNILRKVRPGLRLELRAALYHALHKGERTDSRLLHVEVGGSTRLVQLHVGPVEVPGFPRNVVEVVFEEKREAALTVAETQPTAQSDENSLVARLEEELQRTRERLQTIIEEHELSNQELKVSNEELQSINEELKSTTEELETSKEELQSMNEELITVNGELKFKIEELSRSNSDLSNLIASTNVGVVFLDEHLRIKRFTQPATELFNLIESDIARPFAHVSHQLRGVRPVQLAARIIESRAMIEQVVQSDDERWYILRLFPYRTIDEQYDGVVVTFVDISDVQRAEAELKQRLQQSVVAELGRLALAGETVDALLRSATERVSEILDVEFCHVLALETGGQTLRLTAGVGWGDEAVGRLVLPVQPQFPSGYAVLTGQPAVVENFATESRFAPSALLVDYQIASVANVVIDGQGQPYGTLGVHSRQPRSFASYELDFLQAVANVLGEAIVRDANEAAVRASQQLLQGSMDALSSHIAVLDAEGNIIAVNAGWRNFAEQNDFASFSYGVGNNYLTACIPPSVPHDECDVHGIAAELGIRRVMQGELSEFSMEYPCHSPQERRWFEMRVTRFGSNSDLRLVVAHENITERKLAEEAVLEREARFRMMADSAPALIWMADTTGSRTFSNQPWLKFTGRSLEQDLGDGWIEGIHPDDRDAYLSTYRAALAAQQPFEIEYRRRRADGVYRWLVNRTVPLYEQGAFTGLIGSCIDIHERRQAENDLRFLSVLHEQIQDADDADQLLGAVAKAVGEYLQTERCHFVAIDRGQDQGTILSQYAHNVPPHTNNYRLSDFTRADQHALAAGQTLVNHDIQNDRHTAANFERVFQPNQERAFISVPLMRDGECLGVFTLTSATPRQWQPHEISLLETVSQRVWLAAEKLRLDAVVREREANYRALFEHANDGIFIANAERIYVDVNAAACELSGYAAAELIGKSILDLTPLDAQARLNEDRERLQWGNVQTAEWELLRKDGTRLPIEVSAKQLPDGRWQAFVRDITERKAADAQRAYLAGLLQILPDAVIAVDTNKTILAWNQGAEQIYGWTAAEALGRNSREMIVLGASIEERNAYLQQSLQTGAARFETVTYRPDGSQLATEYTVIPLWSAQGEHTGYLSVNRDITERKAAEALVHQRDELIEQSHDAMIIWELGGTIQYWNQGAQDLYGWSAAEAIGQVTHELLRTVHPVPVAQLEVILRDKGQWRGEIQHTTRTGRQLIADSRYVVVRQPDGRKLVLETNRDITDARQAAEALRYSEERFRHLANAMPQIVFAFDATGTERYINQRWVEYTGLSSGGTASALDSPIHPDDKAAVAAAWAEAQNNVTAFEHELRIRDKYGNYRWFLVRSMPVLGEDGAIAEWYGTSTDIDDLKQVGDTLRRNEERLRRANERFDMAEVAANGFVYEWDVPSGQIEYSKNFAAVLGYPAEAIESSAAWWQSLIHPEDRHVHQFATAWEENGADSYNVEYRVRHADGHYLHLWDRGRFLREDNGVLRVVGSTVDISERKRVEGALRASEEIVRRQLNELQAIYTSAPVGLAVLDTELRYLRLNETLARINGLPVAAHLGKTVAELMPDLSAQVELELRQVMESGVPLIGVEVSAPVPANRAQPPVWLESFYPLLADNGKVAGVNVVVLDITERKRLEDQLRMLNSTLEHQVEERTEELQRSNRELDQFAYVASHDLKAPLRAIEHLAAWITEDAFDHLPARSREHLTKLRGRIKRMERLLDDLLAYSRAGRIHHPVEQVDLTALINDIVETVSPPPSFIIQVDNPIPTLNTERVPLELILRNLIANAIKHHHRQDGTVQVRVQERGDWVEFAVTDDGPGIEPQFHERIFEMFQTLQPRDKVEGSGMGLAIVKKIIEGQGGTIQVQSADGQGATFRLTWPR